MEQQNKTRYVNNPVTIVLTGNITDGMDMVRGKAVDFTLVDANAAMSFMLGEYKDLNAVFPVGRRDNIGWGFRKGDKVLQAEAKDFFKAQISDPESLINRSWEKEYGVNMVQFAIIMTQLD